MKSKKKRTSAMDLVDSLMDQSRRKRIGASSSNDKHDPTEVIEVTNTHRISDSTSPLATPAPPSDTGVFDDENTQRFGGKGETNASQVRFGRVTPEKQVRSGGYYSSSEASLAQSENLRVAQERILELETELERLRRENEQLIAAGETLRRRSDDLVSKTEKSEATLQEELDSFKAERRIYKENLSERERDINRYKQKIEELEMRLESDLKKIRVRERELENRLELTKMEEAALIRNKDDIILDLKRRLDQLTAETENYRNRSLDLHKRIDGDQEKFRRTVRALRLALSMLEDGGDNVTPIKKAE